MTIKAMNDKIQAFCYTQECDNCILNNYCGNCKGDFLNNHKECLKAYAAITKNERAVFSDNVNHPKHYCHEGGIECIDEMLLIFGKSAVMSYCLLNAWKYRYRAADKNGTEDLCKSDWYIKRYKELKDEVDNERVQDF